MNNTILVTGGAGYIGAHTCKALKNSGYIPIAYDNLICGHKDFVKWGPFEKGDITDKVRLEEIIAKYNPNAIIHFAAYAYAGESIDDPLKYYKNNVAGTLVLLEAMKKYGISKLVFSSTCSTYGNPIELPISENHPQVPVNPYGQSKLIIEKVLMDVNNAYNIKSISLRYFNAAGADIEGEIGEDHNPETHLIPLILEVVLKRKKHIKIFGNDYNTIDGTCIRDFVHVADLAEAHVLALKGLEQGMPSTAFNLGNSQGFSVMQIIETAERVTECRINRRIQARRPGDPDILIAAITKATFELGWKPRFNRIDEIITHAWNWHKKRFSSLNIKK